MYRLIDTRFPLIRNLRIAYINYTWMVYAYTIWTCKCFCRLCAREKKARVWTSSTRNMYTTYVSVSARISSVRRVSSRIFTKNYKIVKHAMTFRSIRVLNSNTHTLSLSLSLSVTYLLPFESTQDSGRSVKPSFLRICPILGEMNPRSLHRAWGFSPLCSPPPLYTVTIIASFLVSIRPNYSLTLVLASLVRPTFRSFRHSRVLCGSEEKTCNIPISF